MKQITKCNRGYSRHSDRERAITQLHKQGYNHFVCYKDTQAEFALQYGTANWVGPNSPYILR